MLLLLPLQHLLHTNLPLRCHSQIPLAISCLDYCNLLSSLPLSHLDPLTFKKRSDLVDSMEKTLCWQVALEVLQFLSEGLPCKAFGVGMEGSSVYLFSYCICYTALHGTTYYPKVAYRS